MPRTEQKNIFKKPLTMNFSDSNHSASMEDEMGIKIRLLFYYQQGLSARKAQYRISRIYGYWPSDKIVHKWYTGFVSGNLSFNEEHTECFNKKYTECSNKPNSLTIKDNSTKENWDHVLYESIRTGNMTNIKKAVYYGADVNHICIDGSTPLATATKAGRLDIMEYLLDKKADILKVGTTDRSPLAWAIYRGHLEALKLLLMSYRTNVNKTDSKGKTPLIYAVQEGQTSIVEYLINNGADVNKAASDGSTPLTEAARFGDLSVVKLLVAKGAKVDKMGPDGNTPIGVAAKFRYSEIVEYLTMMEGNVCKFGGNGRPPLSWAVSNEDFLITEFLLENGAKGTIQEAFLEAVASGSYEMVKFLKEEGAVVDVLLRDGQKPIDIARGKGHLEIVDYLKEWGVDKEEEVEQEGSSDDSFVVVSLDKDLNDS